REPAHQLGDVVVGDRRPSGARGGVPGDDARPDVGLPQLLHHALLAPHLGPELVVALHGPEVGTPRLVLRAGGEGTGAADGAHHGATLAGALAHGQPGTSPGGGGRGGEGPASGGAPRFRRGAGRSARQARGRATVTRRPFAGSTGGPRGPPSAPDG